MKALAEQINELDGIEIYGRVVGVRGLMVEVAGPFMPCRSAPGWSSRPRRSPFPARVVGFSGGNALLMPFAALEGVRRGCRALVSAVPGSVRPSSGWLGRVLNAMGEPIDGKGPLPVGPSTYPRRAAAGAHPPAGRLADRPRGAGAQHLHHLLPRPAHGHLLGLRCRQIGAAVDAGPQCRGRRLGDRPDRRTRPRGPGVPTGRSRRGGSCAFGGGGCDLRRASADAPSGGLSHARHRRVLPR